MQQLFAEMNAQMAILPGPVQLWMNWMMAVFIASIFFAWKHKLARIVLGVFLLTIPVGLLVFKVSDNIHLLGIAHFLLWAPLLVVIWKEKLANKLDFKRPFGIWILLLSATIVISLLFDIRDIILVLMGIK